MNRLRNFLPVAIGLLSALTRPRITLAANETGSDICDTVVFSNEQYETSEEGSKDNWVCLASYGEHPNSKGMQKFDRIAANAVVDHWNSLPNSGVKLVGLPFYKGHPDIPEFRERYKDTDSYGRIKALQARDTGLFANVRWNDEGKNLIRGQKYHGHSVAWYMKPHPSGSGWMPFALRSVGFTNEPNIPVPPILSANEKTDMNQKQLADMAKALGLPESATYEQVMETVTRQHTFANEAGNCPAELATLKKKLSDLDATHKDVAKQGADAIAANEQLTTANKTLTDTIATLTTEKDTAVTLAANERALRAKPLIEAATKDGRITKAQADEYATLFANEKDFDATAGKLAALKPNSAMHTQSNINPAGRRADSAVATKSEAILLAVNEYREQHKDADFDSAFNAVRKAQPALFTNAA